MTHRETMAAFKAFANRLKRRMTSGDSGAPVCPGVPISCHGIHYLLDNEYPQLVRSLQEQPIKFMQWKL